MAPPAAAAAAFCPCRNHCGAAALDRRPQPVASSRRRDARELGGEPVATIDSRKTHHGAGASRARPLPEWLRAWRDEGLAAPVALARFDRLRPVEVDEMLGLWRGRSLPSGHPLDGLLERLGWWGKAFRDPEQVDPLLFHGEDAPVAIEPGWLPTGLALRWPGLAGGELVRRAFGGLRPLLRARRPGARLAPLAFRGRTSAAMIYRRQPIVDHFRRAGADCVVGLMERRGMAQPFFFMLERAAPERPHAHGAP
jgi:hypothetical protein